MPEEVKQQSAQAKYYAKRMVNDPDFYLKERERQKTQRNHRYATDEAYRERYRQKALDYYYNKKKQAMTIL